MSRKLQTVLTDQAINQALSLSEGEISHIGENGSCYVVTAQSGEAQRARVLANKAPTMRPGDQVLVALNNASEPLVIGLISDSVSDTKSIKESHLKIEGGESVTIQCGASSITMQRDGTVVVRGKKIVSRASGENKLRGYTVKIN